MSRTLVSGRYILATAVSLCTLAVGFVFTSAPAFASSPTVEGESSSNVNSTEARLSAQINAEGSSTSYRVEYGTSVIYGSSTPEAGIGAPQEAVGVLVHLTGLSPGTLYHFRFVAISALGTTSGSDATFTTAASSGPSSSGLPDKRVYEQVSMPGGGEVYIPYPPPGQASEQDIGTELPFQPSDNGNGLVYLGDPPASGKEGNGSQGSSLGNEYLAVRSSTGWGVSDLTPPGSWFSTSYEGFSSDLSMGIVKSLDKAPEFPALTSEVAENPDMLKCGVLYKRTNSDGAYKALFHTTQTPGKCGESLFAGANEGTSSVPGYSHLLFQTPAALTPQAVPANEGNDLYDSVGSQLALVNVLPGGTLDPHAQFGGLGYASFSNVISSDGSRIFWTDVSSSEVYVRENDTQPQSPLGGAGEECLVPTDACTLKVSAGPADYSTATKDGRSAFYIEGGQLWRFDIESRTREQITSPGAEVQGVIGINETGEEGAYIYFVANGALDNAPNAEGNTPVSGEPNLYLYHRGDAEPTFVATLSPGDNNVEAYGYGDWQPDLGHRTAEVTPDGHNVVFVSLQPLTGYENIEGLKQFGGGQRRIPEVFVYRTDTARISCASCAPNGESPIELPAGSIGRGETGVQASSQPTYMTRWISDDGSRVFFDSPEPLVAQDVTHLQDVYEWERNGQGGCRQSANCVYMLSGGNSTDFSYFVGASTTGNDVFFTHRGRLGTKEAGGDEMQLYDARVEGGFPEASLACTGTGCQGVPPAPPIFATPSSVTFGGVGNFTAAPGPVKAKSRSKLAKCKRGFSRKHDRCVRIKKKSKAKARKASTNRRGK